jgi:hypothetical protein
VGHHREADIVLCDNFNPELGYSVRVAEGCSTLFFGTTDPATGAPILTFEDAVRVLGYYCDPN